MKTLFFVLVVVSLGSMIVLVTQTHAAPAMIRTAEEAYLQDLRNANLRDRTTKLEVEYTAIQADVTLLKSDVKAGILQLQNWMVNLVITLVATSLAGLLGGLVLYRKVRSVPDSVRQSFTCPLADSEREIVRQVRRSIEVDE